MALEALVHEITDNLGTVVRDQVAHEALVPTIIHLRTMVDLVEVSILISLEITMVVLLQMIGGEVN